MKVFLLYKDQDFDLAQALPINEKDLTQDLEIDTLVKTMAKDDDFIYDVANKVLLVGLKKLHDVRYRQDVIRDCLKNPAIVREIYKIPLAAIHNKRRHWLGIFTWSTSGVMSSANTLMQMFVGLLKSLRKIADAHSDEFESEGFKTFFSMIKRELSDDYFAIVETHLQNLNFRDGVLLSAKLQKGNEGGEYTLRLPNEKNKNVFKELIRKRTTVYSFYLSNRDDAGARTLSDIKDRGINLAANALAQATDHIDSFLNVLRVELAFYIGCINLYEQFNQMGCPITFPVPESTKRHIHSFHGLYDACLALTMKQKVVGNNINADNKNLVIITGANQGGKSTFLRSIGLAQIMMQAGMFVAAEDFHANLCSGVFTHYKRKEDASMKSGKLDEELGRMSDIVNKISPNALMLFNESFAATNEREGSEIARQITSALIEKQIKVFFVTHLYEFARIFHDQKLHDTIFLRAERKSSGKRTFKVVEGEPLQTSFGEDVYQTVFENKKEG
ncbi:MAG: hypothetical protein JW704_00350 [Anaerolineaceae bacterium]|nr:hypothetical protein [Anaerolineaceae bacterium]MBN2676694.1 hypothetical protein [Anaerolineaceae bacterium]